MEGKTQQAAAAAAGMSERSVRTWRKGPLPSEKESRRMQRTRPALKLRSCVAPSIRHSCSWAVLTVCRYSSTSSSLSSREVLKPGTRLVGEWSSFLGKLAISHSTSEKKCSNAIISTGVRRRPPVPGMNSVSTNSLRALVHCGT